MSTTQSLGRTNFRAGLRFALQVLPWAVVGLMVLAAVLAPLIAPYDPIQSVGQPLVPLWSRGHPLGTDSFGRDQLSRLLHGLGPMMFVAIGAVILALILGGTVGLFSGVTGGRVDWLIMRGVDILMSFPLILAAILVIVALGSSLVNLMLAVSISQIPIFARLSRALASGEVVRDYVLAARATGFGPLHIMLREVAPNIVRPLLVQATSIVSVASLTAAALSYLGLGTRPPQPDLGYMVKEGQELIFIAPEQTILPGLVIAIFVLAMSFCGDQLNARERSG